MFNATIYLTIATIFGLIAGFAREWLLIDAWGAGTRSDAFMVALFLPEAIRMTLATGLLSAAALPLFIKKDAIGHGHWLLNQSIHFIVLGCILSTCLTFFAPVCVYIIGPGLLDDQHHVAVESLQLLAWVIPGLFLHALFSIPHQSGRRFIRVGLGSFLFNLPIVIYLFIAGDSSTEAGISYSFVGGSVLMLITLLPQLPKINSFRPTNFLGFMQVLKKDILEIHILLFPLLLSSSASQGLALLERMIASFMGEGAITLINLARKLINIPLVALISLNQVLLGKMSEEKQGQRIEVLKQGIEITTIITLSAAVGFICASSGLIDLLLPDNLKDTQLPLLLAWMATTIVFASWNVLFARYYYADGDTRTPLRYEIIGSALNAIGLIVVAQFFSLAGIVISALLGILLTGFLLVKTLPTSLRMVRLYLISGLTLSASFVFLYPVTNTELSSIMQLLFAAVVSLSILLACSLWLRPWVRG